MINRKHESETVGGKLTIAGCLCEPSGKTDRSWRSESVRMTVPLVRNEPRHLDQYRSLELSPDEALGVKQSTVSLERPVTADCSNDKMGSVSIDRLGHNERPDTEESTVSTKGSLDAKSTESSERAVKRNGTAEVEEASRNAEPFRIRGSNRLHGLTSVNTE